MDILCQLADKYFRIGFKSSCFFQDTGEVENMLNSLGKFRLVIVFTILRCLEFDFLNETLKVYQTGK